MLIYERIPAVSYSDPWSQDLPTRLHTLAQGKRRIAYFYELADNSTFRYRAYNMVQVLNTHGSDISASYFFLHDMHRMSEIADIADMLIVCRTRYDHRVNRLITAFRLRNKEVVFDIDDFVFDVDYAHLVMSSLDRNMEDPQEWDFWFSYISRLGMTMRMCDRAITTNHFLADRIREYAGHHVSVIPNFLNQEQITISNRIFELKQSDTPPADGPIYLGYFSGSPSHNKDFAIVVPALSKLLEEDARLNLLIAGYINAGRDLDRFGSRVRHFEFHDFINLQRLVGSVHFNLMPLQNNKFTNCKSELKYFEAAIAGTQSIASPSYTYANAILDGDNGYIAKAHQWRSVICRAVDNISTYASMATRSRDDAYSKYAWLNQRDRIVSALGVRDPVPR